MREGIWEDGKGRECEARERTERKEGRKGGRKGGRERGREGKRKEGREGGREKGRKKEEREGERKATLYIQTEFNMQLFVPIAEEGFQGPPMTEGSLYQGTAILD